jgi:hypothetical protein
MIITLSIKKTPRLKRHGGNGGPFFLGGKEGATEGHRAPLLSAKVYYPSEGCKNAV